MIGGKQSAMAVKLHAEGVSQAPGDQFQTGAIPVGPQDTAAGRSNPLDTLSATGGNSKG
jgi:hypothetical protein